MPPRGWKKPKVESGSREERALLLASIGFGLDEKAILLRSAVDAIRANLSSPDESLRLRAAGMALSILGAKPSRNPMAPTPAPTRGVEDEDDWASVEPAPQAAAKPEGSRPSLRGPVDGPADEAVDWDAL